MAVDHCNLHAGVNILTKVISRQSGDQESNLRPLSRVSNALTTRLPSYEAYHPL